MRILYWVRKNYLKIFLDRIKFRYFYFLAIGLNAIFSDALSEKVNEAVELINSTTQRCETLNTGITEIESAEAEAKAKLLELIKM